VLFFRLLLPAVQRLSLASSLPIVAVALAALAGGIHSAQADWQLVWSDEFNGTTVDTTKWTFETGNNNGWGNSEREYYTGRTNNAYVANGVLHIVARLETTNGFPYTSARMKTEGQFSQLYGRIEYRARLPHGLGFWPALWMLGTNITSVGWPACGEIDVMESKGIWTNQVQGTIHYSDSSNNHLSQTKVYTLPMSGDSVTNFHTYAIEWATNSIQWLVDSNIVQTWTSWSSSTGPYPAPYNQPFFILMNLAIGGNYVTNPPDATINANTPFPGEMQVDYVRVYDFVASKPNAPTGLTASPGSAKVYLSWDASTSGATGYNVKRATNSGGPYTTVASPATNNYTDAGVSMCSTYYYVVSATNSLGESTNSSETTAALGGFALAVNSGGSGAGQFVADANFTGGTQATPVTTAIDTSGLVAPAPQAVYQTERYSNFTYTFTGLGTGLNYKVRLHFAETFWTAVGQRRFNVFINGAQVLTNFDIIAAAGAPNKATIQEFTATPSSGQIVVQYTTVTDNAKSSGIEILLPQPGTPTAGNNGPIWAGTTLNLTASAVPGATYNWSGPNGFSSTSQNPSITKASTNAGGFYSVTATVGGCVSAPGTTTVTVNPPASLAIQFSSGKATLSWPVGTLQSASNVTGPWYNIGGATSPYTNVATTPQEFFRLKLQ
jgi:beta-glucanase (GH16 family)